MTQSLHVSCRRHKQPLHNLYLGGTTIREYAPHVSQNDKMHHYKHQFGERLRNARERAGETQSSAADKLSKRLGRPLDPSRIGNYEQGTRLPDPLVVQELCGIYNAAPSAIYGFTEAPATPDEVVLISKYRQTDERGKKAIQSIANSQPSVDDEPSPQSQIGG